MSTEKMSIERLAAYCGKYMPTACKIMSVGFINKITSRKLYIPIHIGGLIIVFAFLDETFYTINNGVKLRVYLYHYVTDGELDVNGELEIKKILSDAIHILSTQEKWNEKIMNYLGIYIYIYII